MDKIIGDDFDDDFDEDVLMLLLKKPSILIDDCIANLDGSSDRAIVRVSNTQKYRTTTIILNNFEKVGVFETLNTIYIDTRGSFYQRNVSKFA